MAKRDLAFEPPLMNAAGTLGFFPDLYSPVNWNQFGAFITNPISLTARTPSHGDRFAIFPGGFLLHTGCPNPGFAQSLRRFSPHWEHSPLPVIVHLLASDPSGLTKMVSQLEALEGVNAVEVGIDRAAIPGQVSEAVQASNGELPVIVRLPMERATELASIAIQAGALAVSLAPPRGMLPSPTGEVLQGRLYGPSIFPATLRVVHELTQQAIPTIGCGGIYNERQYKVMLAEGALAVQLDAVLWRAGGSRLLS